MQNIVLPAIDWLMIAPVSIVIITGIIALIIEMLQPRRNNNPIVAVSLTGLACAMGFLWWELGLPAGETFGRMVVRDQMATFLQMILVGACFIVFLFSEGYMRQKRIAWAEFYPLAAWSTAGGMLMVATDNLLMLFLGLEVLSIALYCMAGMGREEQKSEESSLKYFLLGAFASAFFLMGIAFLYGATGSIHLKDIAERISLLPDAYRGLVLGGALLMLIGTAFKMALAPFHQWTPDVYQGAPTNVTAFMAAASKVAAVGMLIRLLTSFVPIQAEWFNIMAVLAALTMVVGNAAALVQKDVKRILGYSSIANAGYVLVAILSHFAAPAKVPLTTVFFFLAAYVVMVLGTFAVLSLAAKSGEEGTRFEDLHGMWNKAPFAAGLLIIFVASQIGIPPTGGFFAKGLIFLGALDAGLEWLAIILAVTSVVSAAYYLAIIRACFVSETGAASREPARQSPGASVAMVSCAAGVFAVVALIGFLSDSDAKAKALRDADVMSDIMVDPAGKTGVPVIQESSAPPAPQGAAPGANSGSSSSSR